MNEELKPCPKCGNKELEWHRFNLAGSDKGSHSVHCYECKFGNEYFATKEQALKAWDKRV